MLERMEVEENLKEFLESKELPRLWAKVKRKKYEADPQGWIQRGGGSEACGLGFQLSKNQPKNRQDSQELCSLLHFLLSPFPKMPLIRSNAPQDCNKNQEH